MMRKLVGFPVNEEDRRKPMHMVEKDRDWKWAKGRTPHLEEKGFRIATMKVRPGDNYYSWATIQKGDIFYTNGSMYDWFAYKLNTEDEQWNPYGNYLGNNVAVTVTDCINDFYDATEPITEEEIKALFEEEEEVSEMSPEDLLKLIDKSFKSMDEKTKKLIKEKIAKY